MLHLYGICVSLHVLLQGASATQQISMKTDMHRCEELTRL